MNESKKKEILKIIKNSLYMIFISLVVAGSGILHTYCQKEVTNTLVPGIIAGIITFFATIHYLISNIIKITKRK